MEVDAIRSTEDILEIREILRQKGAGYELLFVMGINTSLRIGDLLSLSVGDVMNGNGEITSAIALKEEKTGKIKRFPVNESLRNTLAEYFTCQGCRAPAEPLFVSRQGRLSRIQAWRVLKAAGESAGLNNIGTHSLRKTFGYHAYKKSGADIGLIQKLLNHSASKITLRYIGIDKERMENAVLDLNL